MPTTTEDAAIASDDELLARCASSDVSALRALYDRHVHAVLACAIVVARRPGSLAPDDLVVRAFVRLWDDVQRGSWPGHAPLAALLVRVST